MLKPSGWALIVAHTSCSIQSQLHMEGVPQASGPEVEELLCCNTHKPAFFSKPTRRKLPQDRQLEILDHHTPGCQLNSAS